MNGFLLDTNIPSETLRPRPDAHVAAWLESQAKESQFLSVVTVGELRKGATLLQPSARRAQVERLIEALIPSWFAGRILPVTVAIAERWGVLDAQRQLAGIPLGVADGMIAATRLGTRPYACDAKRQRLRQPRRRAVKSLGRFIPGLRSTAPRC